MSQIGFALVDIPASHCLTDSRIHRK